MEKSSSRKKAACPPGSGKPDFGSGLWVSRMLKMKEFQSHVLRGGVEIKVSEIMTRDVEVVQSTDTLQEAARKMRDRNVGALPVYAGGVLAGVVTDRDVTVNATAEGVDPKTGRVEDVMTWNVEWCRDDDGIVSVARIMETKSVRRLVVLDRSGGLVGVISLSDIATKAHESSLVEQIVEATAGGSPKNVGDSVFDDGRILER